MALSKIFVAPKNGQGGVKIMEKTNFGTSGTIIAQNGFFFLKFVEQVSDRKGVGGPSYGHVPSQLENVISQGIIHRYRP